MFYKWSREDGDSLLESNECFLDFSFISEENFILILLLTSHGDLHVHYSTMGVGEKQMAQMVVSIREFAPAWTEAVSVSLFPDASGAALILSNGNILLIPIRKLIDVPWGVGGVLADEGTALVEVDAHNETFLRVPTSSLCYNSIYTKRPYLIYSNKAGQIFIVDLTIRKVSAMLGAPQSIHFLQVFTTKASAYLLVTGFTGAQWLIPLEDEEKGLRETLGQIIPSELRQLHKSAARLTASQDGHLCLLDMEKNKVQVFESVSMENPVFETNVPENTWLVYSTDTATFTVSEQTTARTSIHFGLASSFSHVCYEEFEEIFPDERVLGVIPVSSKELLPSFFFVTEKSLLRISPNRETDEILVDFLARRHFKFDVCERLATRTNSDIAKFIPRVVHHALKQLSACRDSQDREQRLEEISQLVVLSPLEIGAAVRLFSQHSCAEALLPALLSRCRLNRSDPSRHLIVSLFVSKVKKSADDTDELERSLREFLEHQTDVSSSVEELLECRLWSCVAMLCQRCEANSEPVARFLAASEAHWTPERSLHIVKTLLCLSWNSVSTYADALLQRMVDFLPKLRSPSQISAFARIGEEQMTRYPKWGSVLYVLSSIRLLANSQKQCGSLLLSPCVLSSGSNCMAAISESESLLFWGEFGAVMARSKEKEPSCGGSLRSKDGACLVQVLPVPGVVCTVSCGTEHLLCLTADGVVYSMGKNRFGQCGVGHNDEVIEMAKVVGEFEGVRCLKAGHYHSMLVDAKGRVFSWGWGLHGQLAHEDIGVADVLTPRLISSFSDPVIAVECGYAHSVLLTESGEVFACGNGTYGQLGCGEVKKRFALQKVEIPDRVRLISSKYFHCVAVTEQNKLFLWGSSPHSVRMRMVVLKRLRANRRRPNSTAAVVASDKLLEHLEACCVEHVNVSQVENMVNGEIVFVDAGYSHTAALTKAGLLYTWGKGLEMQLGHGNKKDQEEPHQLFEPADVVWKSVSCGFDFTSAMTEDGSMYVWGRNDRGQLGVQADVQRVTRNIVFKSQKGGTRTIPLAGDSCSVPSPRKLPAINLLVDSESVSNRGTPQSRLIDVLKNVDSEVAVEVSKRVHELPSTSPEAVLAHFAAGDLSSAVEALVQLPRSLLETPAADLGYSDTELSQESTLLDFVWNLIVNHSNFAVQWNSLSTLLSNCAIGERLLQDRRLSSVAPNVLIASELLDGLSPMEKLRLIEKWQPEPTSRTVIIAQSELQNTGDRVRFWSCCGRVENYTPLRGNGAEKRRVCSKCAEKWKSSVRAKFSRND